jgi:GT2 family glycosyltransferase
MSLKKRLIAIAKVPFRFVPIAQASLWISSFIPAFARQRWRLFQIIELGSRLSGNENCSNALYAFWARRYKRIHAISIEIGLEHLRQIGEMPNFVYFKDTSADEALAAATIESIKRQSYARAKIIEKNVNGQEDGILNPDDLVIDLEPGDRLDPNALLEIALRITGEGSWEIAYFDEDAINADCTGAIPFFKPDYDPLYRRNLEYLKGACVFKAKLLSRGGLEELADIKVLHIPEILVHKYSPREIGTGSCNENHTRKMSAETKASGGEEKGSRVFTIIVPTKDNVAYLARCVESILSKTDYPNFEILIVDNHSDLSETFRYLENISRDNRVRILSFPWEFNFSAINNFAVRHSKGDYLVFLNNDVEVIAKDWLSIIGRWLEKPSTGCVGAKLLYGDGTIQHVGATLGMAMGACHYNVGSSQSDPGYFGMNILTREATVLTAACVGIRKSVYEKIGGFDEALPVAFNDVELCVRLHWLGYVNIFDPRILLYHHESRTRGYNDNDLKRARERTERNYFIKKTKMDIRFDPCYNANLSLRNSYCLSFPPRTVSRLAEISILRGRRVLLMGGIKREGYALRNRMLADAKRLEALGYEVILGADTFMPRGIASSLILIGDDWAAADAIVKMSIRYAIAYSDPFHIIEWSLPISVQVFHFGTYTCLKEDQAIKERDFCMVSTLKKLDREASERYGTIISSIDDFEELTKVSSQ